MFYVALVNVTDHEITFAEEYQDREAALERVRKGLAPQAEMNAEGLGTCEKGKEWLAYGPADVPFAFPEEPVNA